MVATLVWVGLKAVIWGLALVGFAGLVLAAMIATPIRRPPELTSISATAGAVDRSDMPPLQRFHARDGTELAYRHYPARGPASGQAAVLIHGSSGSSVAVHALARAVAARGDIAYLGQLEDDMYE